MTKLKMFPAEGKCKTTCSELEQYLIKTRGKSTYSNPHVKTQATSIAWDGSTYWFVINYGRSGKPHYDYADLLPFIKETSKPTYTGYTAIECTTQQEWDFICQQVGYNPRKNWFADQSFGKGISYCVRLHGEESCSKKSASQVINVDEYCTYRGIKNPCNSDTITYNIGDSLVLFDLPYTVERRYLTCGSGNNNSIFSKLGMNSADKYKFVSDVVGYSITDGDFPVVHGIEDLNKVIVALKERIAQYKILTEKWAVGTYVLMLVESPGSNSYRKGDIVLITSNEGDYIRYKNGNTNKKSREDSKEIMWFATEEEAIKYKETILMPPKEEKSPYIVGNWYKFEPKSSGQTYYLKFHHLDKLTFWASEYVSDGSLRKVSGNLSITNYNITEATEEEMKPFLPKEVETPKEVKKRTCPYPHGTAISCTIESQEVKSAIVCYEGNFIYICQDSHDGDRCSERFGFKYSWVVCGIMEDWDDGCSRNEVSDIEVKSSVESYSDPFDSTYFDEPEEVISKPMHKSWEQLVAEALSDSDKLPEESCPTPEDEYKEKSYQKFLSTYSSKETPPKKLMLALSKKFR